MQTIRRYTLGVSLLLALAFSSSAIAAPNGGRGDDPLTAIRKLIVKILEDVAIKGGLPPG